MSKLFKILVLTAATTITLGLSPLANAYCVYNQSNVSKITVEDKDYGKLFKFHLMGPHTVDLNGPPACCPKHKKGCNKGAYIKAVDPSHNNQSHGSKNPRINSQAGVIPTPPPGPSGQGIVCKTKVPAGGYVTIQGGKTEPFQCVVNN